MNPSRLTCASLPGAVDLSWINPVNYDDFIIDLDDDLLDDDDMDDMFASDMGYRLMEREFSPDSVVSSGHVTSFGVRYNHVIAVCAHTCTCRCDVTVVCV